MSWGVFGVDDDIDAARGGGDFEEVAEGEGARDGVGGFVDAKFARVAVWVEGGVLP